MYIFASRIILKKNLAIVFGVSTPLLATAGSISYLSRGYLKVDNGRPRNNFSFTINITKKQKIPRGLRMTETILHG